MKPYALLLLAVSIAGCESRKLHTKEELCQRADSLGLECKIQYLHNPDMSFAPWMVMCTGNGAYFGHGESQDIAIDDAVTTIDKVLAHPHKEYPADTVAVIGKHCPSVQP